MDVCVFCMPEQGNQKERLCGPLMGRLERARPLPTTMGTKCTYCLKFTGRYVACTAAEGCKELRSADGDVRRGRARRDRKRSSDCKQEDVSADFH